MLLSLFLVKCKQFFQGANHLLQVLLVYLLIIGATLYLLSLIHNLLYILFRHGLPLGLLFEQLLLRLLLQLPLLKDAFDFRLIDGAVAARL